MNDRPQRATASWAEHWTLDPAIRFLNHGSFGACPRAVLARQSELRAELEREPVRFLARELENRIDLARAELAAFLGADPQDLAFVPNATTGVNAVVRSLRFAPGDEILVTNHAYNACANAIAFAAEGAGARMVRVAIPFPLDSPDQVVAAVDQAVTERTKLALIEHVTSPTALLFPIARLTEMLARRGVDTLVDGAHALGMVPLDLRALGAAYYTANCHKWLCAPKGAAFLHVRRDKQAAIRPLVISHGANAPLNGRSRFQIEFDWTGTGDPTPYLCVPEAIRVVGSLMPGGWPAIMARNHELAVAGRAALCSALAMPAPCPETMLGTMATIPLPGDGPADRTLPDPLQVALFEQHAIEVPISLWPAPPRRTLRISAHLYNQPEEYAELAATLAKAVNR